MFRSTSFSTGPPSSDSSREPVLYFFGRARDPALHRGLVAWFLRPGVVTPLSRRLARERLARAGKKHRAVGSPVAQSAGFRRLPRRRTS